MRHRSFTSRPPGPPGLAFGRTLDPLDARDGGGVMPAAGRVEIIGPPATLEERAEEREAAREAAREAVSGGAGAAREREELEGAPLWIAGALLAAALVLS